jgi:hypothetical protein
VYDDVKPSIRSRIREEEPFFARPASLEFAIRLADSRHHVAYVPGKSRMSSHDVPPALLA